MADESPRNAQQRALHEPVRLVVPGSPLLRPVTPHEQRMRDIGRTLPPPPGHPDAAATAARVQRLGQLDLVLAMKTKAIVRRTPHWMRAQDFGGSGFQMAALLRHFWREYADRMMKHGIYSLPSSFNVIEAFLKRDDDMFLFGLRPEREHLLNPQEYFSWYERRELPRDMMLLTTAMDNGVIYSYDFCGGQECGRIAGPQSAFVVAGASFIRHDHELSVILLCGENPPRESDEEINNTIEDELRSASKPLGKEHIDPAPDLGTQDRYLERYPGFARVVVLARFDLRLARHEVRHFLVDIGTSYRVLSDDPDVLECIAARDVAATTDFSRYDVCFTVLASMVYLPIAMLAMLADTQDIVFQTELGSRVSEQATRDAIRVLGEGKCHLHRTVRCLRSMTARPFLESQRIAPPEIQYDLNGYWRRLAPGEVGQDSDGRPVIGRTWVTRHETWHIGDPHAFTLTHLPPPSGDDPGTLYVVRSPGHAADLYKIGLTRRSADTRSNELGRVTGVPLPFEVLATWDVGNCTTVEAEVHRRLQAHRVNPKREFFHGKLQYIISVINDVIDRAHRS